MLPASLRSSELHEATAFSLVVNLVCGIVCWKQFCTSPISKTGWTHFPYLESSSLCTAKLVKPLGMGGPTTSFLRMEYFFLTLSMCHLHRDFFTDQLSHCCCHLSLIPIGPSRTCIPAKHFASSSVQISNLSPRPPLATAWATSSGLCPCISLWIFLLVRRRL
jgi:hypothetical protein